ncbi:hypothetical protein FRB97_008316, partial [Tulasnella sp. 331]
DAPLTSLSLSEIDHIVQILKAALESFQHYIHNMVTRYNLRRNMIGSKSYKLPAELLSGILLLSIPLQDWSISRLQELAQVSRYWKNVITNTPELWAFAKATHNHLDSSWKAGVDLALRKSHGLPLTVCFAGQPGPSADPAFERARCDAFVERIERHKRRWKAVEYVGFCSPAMVSALERSSLTLQSLAIKFVTSTTHTHPYNMTHPARINIDPKASLRHIEVTNVSLTWSALSNLITLCVHDVVESVADVTVLLQALRASPQLEVLDLCDVCIVGDLDEQMHEDITKRLAREPNNLVEPLHFPSLTTLRIRHVHPSLFRALTNIHAQAIRCLYLSVPAALAHALPEINPSLSISHTLERVLARNNQLDIVVLCDLVVFHSEVIPDGPVDKDSECSFDFELGRRGWEAVLDVAFVVECMARLLNINTLTAPLSVRLGRRKPRSPVGAGGTFDIPFSLLEAMPTLTELQIYRPLGNATSILEHLSTPVSNGAGELLWPCPQLVKLHIHLMPTDLARQLSSFIANRCCSQERGGSLGYPPPVPLSTLTWRGADPQLFSNVAGVGVVNFVGQ